MSPETLPSRLPEEGSAFANRLLSELVSEGLGAAFTQVDHLCYRVTDVERYEAFKRAFADVATLLSEAYINGRPIASYKLHRPIALGDGRFVSVIELPAPKPGAEHEEGFEHIEVVTSSSLAELLTAHAHRPFDLRNARAEINPDASLRLPSGLVKFHEESLEAVIAAEQAALSRAGLSLVVVLDLDDTLLVTREPFLEAMRRAISARLGREVTAEETRDGARPTFPKFFGNFGIVTPEARLAALAEFQRQWSALESHCFVPTGVHSLLSCLRSEGAELLVWSARDHLTVRSSLARFSLDSMVDGVHAYDPASTGSEGKPEPTAELTERCALPGVIAVLLGDSDSDARGAATLGASFLQATWVNSSHLRHLAGEDQRCASPLEALSKTMRLRRGGRV